ncbi:cytochrome b [Gloeobacter kilaueensis]|uniref:Cytochrome B561 n=1 Tax=Gloeobacter kilaueensis (strain ATCC BAA-2537 / CCAP 1431/1 / ULC 316 / JS1) TaxID=1183438 RepID=U5QJS7_GLOK1|nr:cytochrome b/b6 domain-containing protein [Gloeobacter kilaueensis]AGY59247.1 cytochrome B561 [Gloeobacter kilaueensis JS1]
MATAKVAVRKPLRWLHWTMAICYAILFTVGIYMVNLPEGVSYTPSLFAFHKSMGVLVLLLLTARILLLIPTIGPPRGKNWLPTAALHTILYLAMIVVPISGYFFSNTSGHGVALFGLALPTLFAKNKAIAELAGDVHGWLAYTFLAFIAIHMIAQRSYLLGRWKRLTRGRATRA